MPAPVSRRGSLGLTAAAGAAATLPAQAQARARAGTAHQRRPGTISLLTDPFLQLPGRGSTRVVWFTEIAGDEHVVLVGDGVDRLTPEAARDLLGRPRGRRRDRRAIEVHRATTRRLSRTAEDADSQLPADRKPAAGIAERRVYRHEALVRGVRAKGAPYRVLSTRGRSAVLSDTYRLRGAIEPGEQTVIMLTSDHQAMVNTPANMHFAHDTITAELGPIGAVIFAGDLVNIPDRASEWFDDQRGSAFFPALQGRGGRAGTDGVVYRGAPVIQNAPIFPAVGNHEVQGRRHGQTSLNASFNNPVPKDVAEQVWGGLSPAQRPSNKSAWLEDNSFSTTTYEEVFTLPEDSPGGKTYYAVTIGDVRLISLYSTRIWRGTTADPDPAARAAVSRYQESKEALTDPLKQGYGEFVFEDLAQGSAQYRWLEKELRSRQSRRARYRIVMLHEGPQGLGDNVMAPFAHPVRVEEKDDAGAVVGVRYEYPAEQNILLHHLQPLLEKHGVDLVYNGHSHLWNRFLSGAGTHYLEASNTGNSYGAYHPLSGRSRPAPPAPWRTGDYLAQGNPGGLDAVVPTIAPLKNDDGTATPFIASNDHVVFQALHTGTGTITSWYVDMRTPERKPVRFDEFQL